METLRRAMLYIEGPKPGTITLTVARKISNPSAHKDVSSGYSSMGRYNKLNSIVIIVLHNIILYKIFFFYFPIGVDICRSDAEGITPDHSICSETSDSTVIFLPPSDNSFKFDKSNNDSYMSNNSHKSQKFSSSRNPVIDRLTGHLPNHPANNNALRNESYYRVSNL